MVQSGQERQEYITWCSPGRRDTSTLRGVSTASIRYTTWCQYSQYKVHHVVPRDRYRGDGPRSAKLVPSLARPGCRIPYQGSFATGS